MKKQAIALAAFFGTAAMAGLAFAEEDERRGPKPPLPIKEIDTDDDGAISKDELAAFQAARFAEIDTNEDGQLTKDELEAAKDAANERTGERRRGGRRMGPGDGFDRMDKDKSGALSQDEFAAPMDWMFSRLDADEDGLVTEEELENARGRRRR
ncbi:MAG: EF-hand domain-containing protein [Pseudomonadota bacterium]